MVYTPSHAEMSEHPKTKRLARLLGCERLLAIGALHALWHFALRFAPDGDLTAFDAGEIADGIGWQGDPAALIAALQEARWLDGMALHDWDEYGGKAMREQDERHERARRQNAERQRRYRERHATPARNAADRYVTERNAEGKNRVPEATKNPSGDAGSGERYVTLRNVYKIRGEENREEESSADALPRARAGEVALSAESDGAGGATLSADAGAVAWLKARFAEFKALYPKPINRGELWPLWQAVCTGDDAAAAIMAGLTAWVASDQWTEDGGRFIPNAKRWLEEEWWTKPPQKGGLNGRTPAAVGRGGQPGGKYGATGRPNYGSEEYWSRFKPGIQNPAD